MAKKFSELRAKMAPDTRAQAEHKTQAMLNEEPLIDQHFLYQTHLQSANEFDTKAFKKIIASNK